MVVGSADIMVITVDWGEVDGETDGGCRRCILKVEPMAVVGDYAGGRCWACSRYWLGQ